MGDEERLLEEITAKEVLVKSGGKTIATCSVSKAFTSDSYCGEELRLGFTDGTCLWLGITRGRSFTVLPRKT